MITWAVACYFESHICLCDIPGLLCKGNIGWPWTSGADAASGLPLSVASHAGSNSASSSVFKTEEITARQPEWGNKTDLTWRGTCELPGSRELHTLLHWALGNPVMMIWELCVSSRWHNLIMQYLSLSLFAWWDTRCRGLLCVRDFACFDYCRAVCICSSNRIAAVSRFK